MINLKEATSALAKAKKMMESTTSGIKENIEALDNVTEREAEILRNGISQIDGINVDINKRMRKLNDLNKL